MTETADDLVDRPRLAPVAAGDDPRLAEIFAKGLNGPNGEPLNIFGTLGHHPDLLKRWIVFAAHVLSKSTLPPRDRELLILRTGWNCQSRYEFIALSCDISPSEVGRTKGDPSSDATWSTHDALLLRAADELHSVSTLSNEVWAGLSATYTTAQMLDVIAAVGNYHLVAMFLNATRVALDDDVPDAL
jgi:alkylhydroperoxidase family enzyme